MRSEGWLMANDSYAPNFGIKLAFGFVAGFLATLVFHQIALAVLVATGIAKTTTYSMQAVPPFGVPQVISLAFWGGVWGMVFASIEQRFPRGAGYWLTA